MIELILVILFWLNRESFFGPPARPSAEPPPIERMVEHQAP